MLKNECTSTIGNIEIQNDHFKHQEDPCNRETWASLMTKWTHINNKIVNLEIIIIKRMEVVAPEYLKA